MSSPLETWKEAQEQTLKEKWEQAEALQVPKKCRETLQKGFRLAELSLEVVKQKQTDPKALLGELAAYFPHASLTEIQARAIRVALASRESMVLCAPTGSGKTDVAVAAVLKEHIEKGSRACVVYTAPTKALIRQTHTDMVGRLPEFVCTVDTTDRYAEGNPEQESNTKRAQKRNAEAGPRILFTTPERLDALTLKRRIGPTLLILDEIHMLNDIRGGVIESVVIRLRDTARILGMSATIPNYRDVAEFIQAPPENALYYPAEYKHAPTEYKIYGVEPGHSLEELIVQEVEGQTLIFLRRKEEAQTLAEILAKKLPYCKCTGGGRTEQAQSRVLSQTLGELPELETPFFSAGVGIHHGGLPKGIREATEKLFRERILRVVCCTATLAWGINLPAETVIISGTKIKEKERGEREYTLSEIVQMAGRAGRRGYTEKARVVLITEKKHLVPYTRILSFQFPVESYMSHALPARILNEICAGKRTRTELEEWLSQSFAAIRSRSHPRIAEALSDRKGIVHSTLKHLLEIGTIENAKGGESRREPLLVPTELGRIAFRYSIAPEAICVHSQILQRLSDRRIDGGDVLLLLSASQEFADISRNHEGLESESELAALEKAVPYPIRGPRSHIFRVLQGLATANKKVSILLQAHLSGKKIKTASLASDLESVITTAPRLLRAIFEVFLMHRHRDVPSVISIIQAVDKQEWARTSEETPALAGSWTTQTEKVRVFATSTINAAGVKVVHAAEVDKVADATGRVRRIASQGIKGHTTTHGRHLVIHNPKKLPLLITQSTTGQMDLLRYFRTSSPRFAVPQVHHRAYKIDVRPIGVPGRLQVYIEKARATRENAAQAKLGREARQEHK